jgi:hypothetical protein
MAEAPAKEIDRSLVTPAWMVLIVGWAIMFIPFVLNGIIGGFIAGFCGTIMGIVNLTRGVTFQAILQILGGVFGTPVLYFLAWGVLLSGVSVSAAATM